MPAQSIRQKRYFAWAEHHPDQAAAEGKLPKMPKAAMSDFASTPEKGLPATAPKRKRKFYGEM